MTAAWILSGNNVPPKRADRSLITLDFSADTIKPDAPAKPAKVSPVPNTRAAVLRTTSELTAAPDKSGSGDGNGCSVANAIGAALIADKDAMAELASLPTGIRSDADAVMLWNGAWLDAAPEAQELMDQSTIPELRRVVTVAVEALPASCAQVENVGPQLIPIAEPGRTTMVVIGSGVWQWAALIDPPSEPSTTPGLQPIDDWFASWIASGN